MVFAGLYPATAEGYEELKTCLGKLRLNDASLVYEPETSQALGFGYRCGFLGLLHKDIIQERLEREYGLDIVTTIPNVEYVVYTVKGEKVLVDNPAQMPDRGSIARVEEPYMKASRRSSMIFTTN